MSQWLSRCFASDGDDEADSRKDDAIRLAKGVQALCCGGSVEDAISAERKAKHLLQGGGGKKKSQGGVQGGHGERTHLGLPPIEEHYEECEKSNFEQGYQSGLKKWVHKKTRMPRAVLTIPKSRVPDEVTAEDLDKQFKSLCKLDHPNVVPFRETCEDDMNFHLIYEWSEGGPMMHQLWRYNGMLTEGHIAQVIRELLSALSASHQFQLHHLDLGLFSLFLQYSDRLSPIKVFGIGLSGYMFPSVTNRKYSRSNKHYYASPEMFNSKVKAMSLPMRHASDIWSVGTLLYTLVSGRPPFGCGSLKELQAKVAKNAWSFGLEFSEYSSSLRTFLESLLSMPWGRRPSASNALKHPWAMHTQSIRLKDGRINNVAMQQLQSYAHEDHVKQTVARLLTDIGLTIDAYKGLEQKFREMDLNGDGTITLGELQEVSSQIPGITPQEVDGIVMKLDRNGNCNVDISEFIAALVMEQEDADERLIKKAFAKMDKNGDARVTKKELFQLLRQYSRSVETGEVSKFVGTTDKDADQKIDYREFMGLFPQVRDKMDELKNRMTAAKSSIESAPKYVEKYHETLSVWVKKLEAQRNKVEVACGVQQLPEHLAAGAHYSYEKGHFTEFDVQKMIRDIIHTLREIPGRHLTKLQKRAKEDTKMKRKEDAKMKSQMMGITMFSSKAKHDPNAFQAGGGIQRQGSGSGMSSGADSGSEEEKGRNAKEGFQSATTRAVYLMEKDRTEKKMDPEYRVESYFSDAMYWLIRIKSEYFWQQPLTDAIKELRNACVEDIIEVVVDTKPELSKMQNIMSEKYVIREDTKFHGCNIMVHKDSHLLPLGSFEGKKLTNPIHHEKMEDLLLPVTFFFGYAKDDVTAQKIEFMKSTHMEKMAWVGKYVSDVLRQVENLFQEVSEDIAMCGSLESLMPWPPNMSHLYLKHCEGREIQKDAVTPRSSEGESDEEAADDPGQLAVGQSATAMSSQFLKTEPTSQSMGMSASMAGTMTDKRRGKRIERNQVLTAQVGERRATQGSKHKKTKKNG